MPPRLRNGWSGYGWNGCGREKVTATVGTAEVGMPTTAGMEVGVATTAGMEVGVPTTTGRAGRDGGTTATGTQQIRKKASG